MHTTVESIRCTPETNIMYINYTSIKKIKLLKQKKLFVLYLQLFPKLEIGSKNPSKN